MNKLSLQSVKTLITGIVDGGPSRCSFGLPIYRGHVGLDIGAATVKVVQIQETIKGQVIRRMGYQAYPQSQRPDDGQISQEMIAQTIKSLWSRYKIGTNIVSLAISDPGVYLRHLRVPRLGEKELIKAIRWQAEKYTPFPIEDAVVDFQFLKEKEQPADRPQDIMIIAVERKVIDKYVAALSLAKLFPLRIGFAPFAIFPALRAAEVVLSNEVVALIDIGGSMTSVMVVQDGDLQMIRTVAVGGATMTEAMAQGMRMSFIEAERMKKEFSAVVKNQENAQQHDRIWTSLEPVLAELIHQVNRTFAYCEGEFGTSKITRVFLSGGASALSGLKEYFNANLGVPVEHLDPFKRFSLSKDAAMDARDVGHAGTLLAAFGEII